jgi:hypothetical protein
MAVHRIDDNAEALLQLLARAEGKKPSAFLGDLIRDYARGLAFDPGSEIAQPREDTGVDPEVAAEPTSEAGQ